MDRIVLKSRVAEDGVLRLNVQIGAADADRAVQVTVEPVPSPAMSEDEWRKIVLSTAGKWLGDFERPEQGEYEARESLS